MELFTHISVLHKLWHKMTLTLKSNEANFVWLMDSFPTVVFIDEDYINLLLIGIHLLNQPQVLAYLLWLCNGGKSYQMSH